MPPITLMLKPASGMCNMACEYCFYCDETGKRQQSSYGFMSEKTLENVIRRTLLRAEGSATYAFQGGEPTLRGLDFFEKAVFYQKKYNRNGIRIQNALQTNGLALDEDWCRFFHENGFLIGVSVDGTAECHDAYRRDRAGAGTYDRVVQNIRLLDACRVDYNILTVVNRDVAEHIETIYADYARRGWVWQQYIACLDPLEEARGQSRYALLPEEYGDFLIRLFRLWSADFKKGRQQPYIRSFENYISILLGYVPEACDQRGVCGIQYVVEADGSVYPCDFYMLDEYRLGNLNECRLPDLDDRRRKIGFLERSLQLSDACRQCPFFFLCKGGCQRHRDWNPALGCYENYFCQSFRMFFTACLDDMKQIAAAVMDGR